MTDKQKQSEPLAVKDTIKLVQKILEDHKAENIVTVDLRGKTTIGDYMIIASGSSNRQIKALAELIVQNFKNINLPIGKPEGLPEGDWLLLDTGNVIVHLFRPEVRTFYNLEKMWEADLAENSIKTSGSKADH
ncbi:MAG: ribosome silencing factor [Rhodospirillaceae bacterium]|nr:ribosome silencing factor [Rhodospirillaceae bacterium]